MIVHSQCTCDWVLQMAVCKNLLVQSREQKHQKKVYNIFKINNKNTRTTSITLLLTLNIFHIFFYCFCCGQTNAYWVCVKSHLPIAKNLLKTKSSLCLSRIVHLSKSILFNRNIDKAIKRKVLNVFSLQFKKCFLFFH